MDTLREGCLGLSCFDRKKVALPKTNSKFDLENGWLEYFPFLCGAKGPFSGHLLAVRFRRGYFRSIDILNIFFPKVGGFNPLKHF